jgi:dihydrofolate synthase/folylpolyglutamate synthase
VHFVERQVDAAVLEVGLGGRLDSTNVCLPAVSVITSISFDHMKQLGNTLSAIAREKAGIIKPGVPVVCGVTELEPLAVIAAVAREHGCRLIQVGSDFEYQYETGGNCGLRIADCGFGKLQSAIRNPKSEIGTIAFRYTVPGQEFSIDSSIAMPGAHQAANAAVALAAVAELRHQGWCVSSDAMRLGLAAARLPGRVEVVTGEPTVVLDTAHNAASARALVETLAAMNAAARRTLVLSISHDKDVAAIVRELAPHFDRFVVTQYQENPRAIRAASLAQIVRDAFGELARESGWGRKPEASPWARPQPRDNVTVIDTPPEAWRYVVETSVRGERVCITGSFYLAAEMRRLVLDYAAPTIGRR